MSGGWYAIMYSVVLKSRQNTFTALLPRALVMEWSLHNELRL